MSLEAESKTPKAAKMVNIQRGVPAIDGEASTVHPTNPHKYLHASCLLVARSRETDLLSPACGKTSSVGARQCLARSLEWALRVRRGHAARRRVSVSGVRVEKVTDGKS